MFQDKMTDRQRCLTYNDYLIQEKEGIGLLQERKIFPGYMKDVHLPKEACEQEIEAYRICKCGKVDQDAFLNSYEEYVKKGWLNQLDLDDPKSYS